MKKPREIFEGSHGLPVGRVEQGESRLGKFFSGFYYRVAGGGYFTTFLKQNFENLICDGKRNFFGKNFCVKFSFIYSCQTRSRPSGRLLFSSRTILIYLFYWKAVSERDGIRKDFLFYFLLSIFSLLWKSFPTYWNSFPIDFWPFFIHSSVRLFTTFSLYFGRDGWCQAVKRIDGIYP